MGMCMYMDMPGTVARICGAGGCHVAEDQTGAEEPRSRGAVEPRRDRIGTSAVANTTPHGAGALKIGIRGALKTGIAHAVRERRLGRIHCARDVLICWHRRWHRRQAVHTSLHGGVALKSGLAAGIVQLRVGNDGVRRVLGTATDRATDSLVRHRERRHRLHRARLGCGGSEGGGLHWRQSRSRDLLAIIFGVK